MHWIEEFLHISPDGGSGMLEAAIAMALMVALYVAISITWANHKKRSRERFRP